MATTESDLIGYHQPMKATDSLALGLTTRRENGNFVNRTKISGHKDTVVGRNMLYVLLICYVSC